MDRETKKKRHGPPINKTSLVNQESTADKSGHDCKKKLKEGIKTTNQRLKEPDREILNRPREEPDKKRMNQPRKKPIKNLTERE